MSGSACPDCGVAVGMPHKGGCDIERCPSCGDQRISCYCEPEDQQNYDPLPWTGEFPGYGDARRLGFWCRRNPRGPGYVPCQPDHPEAIPDLGRMIGECRWDSVAREYVRPETKKARRGDAGRA